MTRESEVLLVGTIESANGVFCACVTVRLLLGFDGVGTARQPVRQRKRIIAGAVRFEKRRRITFELTRRREFNQASPDESSYETRYRRSRPTICWASPFQKSDLADRLPLVRANTKVFKCRLFRIFKCLMPSVVGQSAVFGRVTKQVTGAVKLDCDVETN